MKKKSIKHLKLNKRSISKLVLFGGAAPQSHGCVNENDDLFKDDDYEWVTDAPVFTCETFNGTGCI